MVRPRYTKSCEPARKTENRLYVRLANLLRQTSREAEPAVRRCGIGYGQAEARREQPAGFWIHTAFYRVDYFILAGAGLIGLPGFDGV